MCVYCVMWYSCFQKYFYNLQSHLDVGVVISGCGDDCTKVVSLVEQLKKKITVITN